MLFIILELILYILYFVINEIAECISGILETPLIWRYYFNFSVQRLQMIVRYLPIIIVQC